MAMISLGRRGAIAICALFGALGVACTEVLALPPGSQSFDPPPEYRLWWSMTEACSGLRGSLADIDWYVVPGASVIPGDSRELGGEWFEQGNRIVLAGADQFEGSLVRHEMLHTLLRASGHPRFEFLERCAGVVVCADECIRDAGPAPAPPAGTPLVSPSAIEVSVKILPVPTRASDFGGYFTCIVTAHNPANHAVVVKLPSYGNGKLGVAFEYEISTDSMNKVGTWDFAYDSEEKFFGPGETKEEPFDLVIGDPLQGRLAPGQYLARGYFGDHRSAPISFTLSQ